MLQKLSINNYAIIDRLELTPDKRLSILTGETGAGKSIIVGALSLILGERADTSVLINKDEKCIVEAVFDVKGNAAFLNALAVEDLDDEQQCIVRREINIKGKSRAFINDTPVRLDVLNKLTSMLVDLHQQFDHLALESEYFQLDVIDAIADNIELRKEFKEVYSQYKSTQKELEALLKKKEDWQRESDYKQYLYNELVEASFKENEIEDAELKLKTVNKAEEVQQVVHATVQYLQEGEQPIVNELQRLCKQLEVIVEVFPEAKEVLDRLNAAQIELDDIAGEINLLGSRFDVDEEEIQLLNDRVDIGYKLQKKHHVNSTNELIEITQQLEKELQSGLDIDTDIAELGVLQKDLLDKLQNIGNRLSENRAKYATSFAEDVNKLLALVGMPNAIFSVGIAKKETPSAFGFDEIQFYLDANKSGKSQAIHKAASGGEMSRIMLCIKSLTAQVMDMPTLIFDEVDMGISGEAAKQVGLLLSSLSQHHQIICITHQPQVAARGDYHLYVYKEAGEDKRINTKVKEIEGDERVRIIAQMLDGDDPSKVAIQNAKALIRA